MGIIDMDVSTVMDMQLDNNFGDIIDTESRQQQLDIEESIAQSSVMESELEYNNDGNIRASTYKRNAEAIKNRKDIKHYKSEERKYEKFFT